MFRKQGGKRQYAKTKNAVTLLPPDNQVGRSITGGGAAISAEEQKRLAITFEVHQIRNRQEKREVSKGRPVAYSANKIPSARHWKAIHGRREGK